MFAEVRRQRMPARAAALYQRFGLSLFVVIASAHLAAAAPLISSFKATSADVQLAGCGLGVRRGALDDCEPVRIFRREHNAYRRGYYRGFGDGYVQGYANGSNPYASYYGLRNAIYPYHAPPFPQCGLNYSISCGFGVCWRRCW